MSKQSIDINQRIPLDTLQVALTSYINGDYSNEYVLEQLRLEFNGENRLKKALRIVNKIILKSPLLDFIDDNREEINSALKKTTDRNLILISLLNSAFPFSYDVLRNFGKYFAVQDVINAESIKKSISNVYGGNRATENGIYSVVPMFLEANLFTRPKQGIYEMKEGRTITHPITIELFKESFLINNSSTIIQDHQLMDPYFTFINC